MKTVDILLLLSALAFFGSFFVGLFYLLSSNYQAATAWGLFALIAMLLSMPWPGERWS